MQAILQHPTSLTCRSIQGRKMACGSMPTPFLVALFATLERVSEPTRFRSLFNAHIQCGRYGQTGCIDPLSIELSIAGPTIAFRTSSRVSHNATHRSPRIPFFFEPNFTANVKPLTAALRLSGTDPTSKLKEQVAYGEFLLAKVGNNFASGEESPRERY